MTLDPDRWLARARLELARRGVGRPLADTVLAEVREHCADSGDHPADAFGDPAAFADTVLTERVPVATRADLDRHGMTGTERRSEVIARLGVVVALAGVVLWISGGLLLPLTVAGLIGTVLTAAAMLTVLYAVLDLRAAGRSAAVSVTWWVVSVVLVVAAALAYTQLPKAHIGELPSPALLVIGIALLWWAFTRKKPGSAPATPDDRWATRVRSLLVGRHGIPRARATELVTEATAHLRDTGTPAAEEFGPADEYAVTLAEHERDGHA